MLSSPVLPRLSASPLAINFDSFKYEPLQAVAETAVESPVKTLFFTVVSLIAAWLLFTVYLDRKTIPGFPIVGQQPWDPLRTKARTKFLMEGDKVVLDGMEKYKNQIFQVAGWSGPWLIVPMHLTNEVRNHEDLSMTDANMQDFFLNYKAFANVKAGMQDHIVIELVQKKLTPMLALITEPVNDENNIAIAKYWPQTDEWKSHRFVEQLALLVSQVSSRVFMGDTVCRNEEWIQIAKSYTGQLMRASAYMQFIPRQLRPAMSYFLPAMSTLSNTVRKARTIIEPEIKRRQKVAQQALVRGEKLPKRLDAIEWMAEIGKGKQFDGTAMQLSMTFAAIHTTSSTLSTLLCDVVEQGMVNELREEIIRVYKEDGGWSKTTLYKLKLLDSVMKESQRVNGLSVLTLNRMARKPLTLSNGVTIPAGVRFLSPNFHMRSEEYYEDATTFDPKRFLKLREQDGNANKYQFVTSTLEHSRFGLGNHACPGRFFASNEMKLIMAHLLLKFDWKFIDGKRPQNLPPHKGSKIVDPQSQMLYKSRIPEIDF